MTACGIVPKLWADVAAVEVVIRGDLVTLLIRSSLTRLPAGKTIDRFDFAAAPSVSKARIMALAEGDAWLTKGTNILIFGPPGVGKSHLGAALGHAMIDAGYRVLFIRTTDLVQHLQAARQDLKLATALEKLDKYHLLVLDDLSYVQKSQAETSVIFELISARYERRSLLIMRMSHSAHGMRSSRIPP